MVLIDSPRKQQNVRLLSEQFFFKKNVESKRPSKHNMKKREYQN